MIKGFRDFLLRGNVIDLAVAVVIGAAFTALVTAFSDALITPVINSFFSVLGLSKDGVGGSIGIPGGQELNFGVMIGAIITFLITAAVVYFVFVVPMNAAKSRMAKSEKEEVITAEELLEEIRDLLKAQAGPDEDSGTSS
ncbi:MAG: large conductance mechanosensitive channel protein MscL [Candidatus Nanopelagicales bacterium]